LLRLRFEVRGSATILVCEGPRMRTGNAGSRCSSLSLSAGAVYVRATLLALELRRIRG
jgi:hypothetical protein